MLAPGRPQMNPTRPQLGLALARPLFKAIIAVSNYTVTIPIIVLKLSDNQVKPLLNSFDSLREQILYAHKTKNLVRTK